MYSDHHFVCTKCLKKRAFVRIFVYIKISECISIRIHMLVYFIFLFFSLNTCLMELSLCACVALFYVTVYCCG